MADVTNELIHDVLKAAPTRLGKIENKMHELDLSVIAMRDHMQALQKDVNNLHIKTSGIDQRIAKIERRMDIVDETAD